MPRFNEDETFNKLVIIQEFPDLFKGLNAQIQKQHNSIEEKEEKTETYYPFNVDMLLKYEDKEVTVPLKISARKINVIKLDKNYSKPLCVILNPLDTAYMSQKFDDNSKYFLLEKTGVRRFKIIFRI